ncbi:unnamed protein product [Cyberlindnera jadinii]|uniref:ARM repeat-containing protein n=1 Tax=Cyberlindnera jadinii (strain ATCC 18201 / CBS 1600 / BCRC 20928 / JCM 3617 / NBRC 0987 / NRRL Y-1542) TaxID=983966 RepID=A0A0H5CAH1_CYBJN|nr:hypothetical protein CYBJADRAFT_165304 [Cyberlindnera jadinii NRRL Y-1542]ODV75931.1 hypothetical protein CYBJADRAFT_165304 [Cyberlindnera jadinii NRRL Y-1542]CEP20634.1 unnamed protein product [Cyberlindnera jadinii]
MSLSDGLEDHIEIPSSDEGFTASPTFAVTDLLTSLGERTQDAEYLVTKGNDLILLLQKFPYIKEDLILSAFGHKLQTLLTHPKKEVVATGYRICRYVVFDVASLQGLISLKLDVLMIISLAKGSHHDIEREQAIKLLRAFFDIPNGAKEITRGLANAVLAIAEQVDDKMRKLCIETSCEICLLRPDLIRPHSIVQFILDGPFELSSMCATTIVSLLNTQEGRKHIELQDMQKIISPFTEFPVKGHLNNDQIQTSAYVISRFLKNLAGLHGFCMDDFKPLRELIACLSFPVNGVVSKLLDLFLDLLMVRPLSKKPITQPTKTVIVPLKLENQFVLSNHYLALIVTILFRCGIVPQLLGILETSKDEGNCTKAGCMLAELANIKTNLVPEEFSIDDSAEIMVNFNSTDSNNGRPEYILERLTRKSYKGRTNLGLQNVKISENFTKISKSSKNNFSYYADETRLRQMISDSKVLSSKKFVEWDCDILTELFQGPFMNGKRLDDINRTTKFLKRLLSFYRPFKHKFSATKRTKSSVRFIKLGCDIITCLLSSHQGVLILKENKIVPQIAECLAQLDPYSGFYAKDQIFSKARLESTLTSGYFTILGKISSYENGLKLMEQWKIFSIIHHISDDPFRREDLIIMFMNEMSYDSPGQLRVLLSKFLHSENKKIKVSATNLLRTLIRNEETRDFACELLVEQLYEQDKDVCSIVISVLSEYCDESARHMDQIINLNPSVNILKLYSSGRDSLLMKFLSTSSGFEYLHHNGFIDQEFDSWVSGEKYIDYALEVDRLLMKMDKDWDDPLVSPSVSLPPNLFGELIKTEEGFSVIVQSGVLTDFVNMVRFYATSIGKTQPTTIDYLRLKACLWSIGLMSTSDLGIETLDVNGCIEDIVQIAYNSPLIDLRGIAFYVLGLISRNMQGVEVLDEYSWCSKLDVYQKSIGISVPKDTQKFIGFNHDEIASNEIIDFNIFNEIDSEDMILTKLVKIVADLCNHVYLNSASKELTTFTKQHPECFEDPDVFYLVLQYFEMYKYRQTVRKFIIEAFTESSRLLETIVKRDKKRMKELLRT